MRCSSSVRTGAQRLLLALILTASLTPGPAAEDSEVWCPLWQRPTWLLSWRNAELPSCIIGATWQPFATYTSFDSAGDP